MVASLFLFIFRHMCLLHSCAGWFCNPPRSVLVCVAVFFFFSHSVLLPDALFQLYTRWFDAQDGDVDLDLDVVPLVPYLNFAHVVFS